MGNFLIKLFIFSLILLQFAKAQTVYFDSDVQIKKNQEDKFTDLKSGQTIKLSPGDFLLAQTKDNLPVLVLAAKSDKANVKITNADISQNYLKKLNSQVNDQVSEIIDALRKSESLMQKREYMQALTILNPVREKYQQNAELLFLSGTLNYLLNNNKIAQDELEKGLEINPKNSAAQKLLENIKGKSR